MNTKRPVDLRSPEGVYVVAFPDRVKIGRSTCVPHRIAQHWSDGGIRAIGFRAERSATIERQALDVLGHRAERIRRTESFTGIPFDDAVDVLTTVTHGVTGTRPEVMVDWDRHPFGDLTERIKQAISDRGKFRGTVIALAGLGDSTFYRRARTGDWKYSEVAAIARVLRMPVERLIGLDDRAAA